MVKYVFIDVQNTASTTQRMLKFVIDWNKLCKYLKESWGCDKIFLYSGIENGDENTAKEFSDLATNFACIVRTKTIIAFKNQDKTISRKCIKCGEESIEVIDMGYRKKSNCDVELTADALEYAGPKTEFYIFTADGDFVYLIEKLVSRGSKINLVSNANKYVNKAGYTISRFSTKLRNFIRKNPDSITMIDINSLKDIIKKDIPTILN